jgi:hypothetical protein
VDVTVEEGRLVELPTADATGIERRAFGEFVGVRGELASYAFGWVTGAEPHVARFTVGIGAGNPGGATFHAIVAAADDGHGFTLVDEPFEEVPEGGPHIGAEEARAHDTLPFIWWVADHVMKRDRRAWWMRHWLLRTRAIQTAEVFERTEPVLVVVNDADDDLWQLIGASDAGPDGKIGHLWHALDEDPTLIDVADLEPGQSAVRRRVGGPWTRQVDQPGA